MDNARLADNIKDLEHANNGGSLYDARKAAIDSVAMFTLGSITVRWYYPRSFDDDRKHWDAIQNCEIYRWMIRGSWIAWRYYSLDGDR